MASLRDKLIITPEEYKRICYLIGSALVTHSIVEGVRHTFIQDTTGFTSEHILTTDLNNKVIDEVVEDKVLNKFILDLSDAKKSVVKINEEVAELPNNGVLELSFDDPTELTYSIDLEGYEVIEDVVLVEGEIKPELTWIKK